MSELSDLTLNFSLRDKIGTSASKQIRAQGRIPAVLYGKEVNRTLSVDDKEMRILLRKAEGTSSLMRLIGEGGEDELVLSKNYRKIKFEIPSFTSILLKLKEVKIYKQQYLSASLARPKVLKPMAEFWRW